MKRALDSVISALRSFPGDPVDLLVGEPCFDPPVEIQAEFRRIVGDPSCGYGPPGGLAALRGILAAWDGGSIIDSDQVVVTHGAKGGLLALLAVLVEPGDEVIHPLPCYPAYRAMVGRFGGKAVGIAEDESGFSGWPDAVAAALTSRTRAVLLSTPSNPSGSTIGRAELEHLVELCRDRGIRLILDEAYSAFRYDGAANFDVNDFDPTFDTMVRLGSASKTLALAGWRIGWIITDARLSRSVEGAQAALLNPPATPPQRAMLALGSVPESYFAANRATVRERLRAMVAAIKSAGFETKAPGGGFYLWVDVRDRLGVNTPDTISWCEQLAGRQGVGVWPGEDFGTPGWVRLALPQGADWREDVAEMERRMVSAGRYSG